MTGLVAARVGRVDHPLSDQVGTKGVALKQPAQLGEREIVRDAVGHRQQNITVLDGNLPQVWRGEPFAKRAIHHVALLEVGVLEQTGRHSDLTETQLQLPVRPEHGVVQRALLEHAPVV